MSLYIGKDINNNSVLHITIGTHSLPDLKSGILSDTIFHNDLPFYSYTIYPITGTQTKSAYVQGPASGNNWSIMAGSGTTVTVREFGMSVEAAIAVTNSYYNNNETSIMYLDSNFNQLNISTSDIGFIDYRTNLNYTIDYGITYCPVPTFYNHIMPCLWQNIGTIISYILVLEVPSKLINSYGVHIDPSSNIFVIGDKSLNNLKYVAIGDPIGHSSIKQINNKIALVDTSLFTGLSSFYFNPTTQAIKLGDYTLFSNLTSLYGIQNISAVNFNIQINRLNYANNLVFTGLNTGDMFYLKCFFPSAQEGVYPWFNVCTGFFNYSEGLLIEVFRSTYNYFYLYCLGGSVYIRTYGTGSTYSIPASARYTIFKN